MTEQIKAMLDALAEMTAQRDLLDNDKQVLIDGVLTPEIRQQVADIEAEFKDRAADITTNIAQLEAAIKERVVNAGASVRGSYLQAVWSKPRITWDTRALDGYAAGHPEIAQFRKEGQASVSIRAFANK